MLKSIPFIFSWICRVCFTYLIQSALSMGSHIDVIVNMIYWQLSHFRAILPINISIFIASETSAPVHWPNLNKYCQRILKFVGKSDI